MDLVDSTLKAAVEAGFEDIFDSFAKTYTFTAYKNPQETIVSIGDYNSDWVHGNDTITYTEVKQDFVARMWYLNLEQQFKEFFFTGETLENAKVVRESAKVKIQVKDDAYNFIKDSKRILVLGKQFEIASAIIGVGIFDFKYHSILLSELP
jgi:hypothetical protein